MKWNQHTPLSEFYEDCYRIQKHTGRSEGTIADYRIAINRFRAFLAASGRENRVPTLADLTDDRLSGFLAWIHEDQDCVPETANKYAANLKAIWRHAVRRKVLSEGPDVDPLPCPKHARKTWTPEQFEQLLEAARRQPGYLGPVPAGVFWPAVLLMIINTAGRINAVMSLEVQDIDLAQNVITLKHENQKDKSDLRFPLLPATREALLELLQCLRGEFQGRLFACWPWDRPLQRAIDTGGQRKKGASWSTLRNHYKRILHEAGLPAGRKELFHCLRAYTATRITAKNGIKAAQAFCDHSAESVTWAYIDRSQAGLLLDLREVFPEHAPPTPPSDPASKDLAPAPPSPTGRLKVFRGDDAGANYPRIFGGDAAAG